LILGIQQEAQGQVPPAEEAPAVEWMAWKMFKH
jgi:hypothetical protein